MGLCGSMIIHMLPKINQMAPARVTMDGFLRKKKAQAAPPANKKATTPKLLRVRTVSYTHLTLPTN